MERIDRYEIVRRIGGGAMAETFEVMWRETNGAEGHGCLKRLRQHHVEDPRLRAAFVREARIAGMLRHRNLVGVIDHALDAAPPYVVFEYVEGLDLRALLERARLTPTLVLYIGASVASALHYAHRYRDGRVRGVLHRDVSPKNVLVSTEGEVRLADFGLAAFQTDTGVTVDNLVAGTIPYVAPEVVRVEPATVMSDLYSLGVVLYELASGRVPYDAKNAYALLRKIGLGEREGAPLRSQAPGFPGAFYVLVRGLLTAEPDNRQPRSAEDVVRGLAACGARSNTKHAMGTLVKSARDTSEAVGVDAEASTPLASRRGPRPAPSRGRRPRRPWVSRRRVASVLLALLGLVMVAIIRPRTTPSGASAVRVAETGPLEPRDEEGPFSREDDWVCEPSEPAPLESGSDTEVGDRPNPGTGRSPSRKMGTLVVRVVPWGNVWLDGRAMGRAPRTLKVRPGEYTVGVGHAAGDWSRRVRVVPGGLKTVTFDLEEAR